MAKYMKLLKEFTDDVDLVRIEHAVRCAYNHCGNEDSVLLHQALGAIELLRKAKEKGEFQ